MNSGLPPSLHQFAFRTTPGIWQQRQSSSLIDSDSEFSSSDSDSELSSDDEGGASNNSNIFSRNGTRRGSNIDQANNAVDINTREPIREPRDQRAREPAFTLSPTFATATATATATADIAAAAHQFTPVLSSSDNIPFNQLTVHNKHLYSLGMIMFATMIRVSIGLAPLFLLVYAVEAESEFSILEYVPLPSLLVPIFDRF